MPDLPSLGLPTLLSLFFAALTVARHTGAPHGRR